MNRVLLSIACVGIALFAGACRPNAGTSANAGADAGADANANANANANADADGSSTSTREARKVVLAWNSALDKHDVVALAPLYAPRVKFYGAGEVTRSALIEGKKRALGKGSTFHQQIVSDLDIARSDDDSFDVRFTKRSGAPTLSDVRARLVLARGDAGSLLIVEETDEPSDDRAKKRAARGCAEIAADVVNALPKVKKLLDDTAKELPKYPDRHMGGVGPLDEDDGGFSVGLGVHQPERYEALVWYTVKRDGSITVSAMGDDVDVPAAQKTEVTRACKR
jgi:hypothetical protein